MTMSEAKVGAKTVQYPMVESCRDYFYRGMELGAVEGSLGAMRAPPELEKLVLAAHHILAGGTVEVNVVKPGSETIVADLDALYFQMTKDANEVNATKGAYISMVG